MDSIVDWTTLIGQLHLRHPATQDDIRAAEATLGVKLPTDYKTFLARSNGADGFVGEAYVMLWSVDELHALNEGYEVKKYAPGYIIFRSDGGGEAFAFDLTQPDMPIVSLPFVGMDRKYAKEIGYKFIADIRTREASTKK
jgi:hypothetical protein